MHLRGRKSPGTFLEKSEPVFAEKLLPVKLKAEGGQQDRRSLLSWREDAAAPVNQRF